MNRPEPIELENNLGPDAVTGEINRVPWMAYDVDEMDIYIAELEQKLAEADKVIAELKADYKEACDRLQTANLIKDEQLAATRHNKYKRCLAMAKLAIKDDYAPWNMKWYHRWLELAEKFKEAK